MLSCRIIPLPVACLTKKHTSHKFFFDFSYLFISNAFKTENGNFHIFRQRLCYTKMLLVVLSTIKERHSSRYTGQYCENIYDKHSSTFLSQKNTYFFSFFSGGWPTFWLSCKSFINMTTLPSKWKLVCIWYFLYIFTISVVPTESLSFVFCSLFFLLWSLLWGSLSCLFFSSCLEYFFFLVSWPCSLA